MLGFHCVSFIYFYISFNFLGLKFIRLSQRCIKFANPSPMFITQMNAVNFCNETQEKPYLHYKLKFQ